MTRALELTLGGSFKAIAGVYVASFPRAYTAYNGKIVEVLAPLGAYKQVIIDGGDAIFRAAAADINRYLNNFSVHANKSPDEFKIIYFVGRSIERHLIKEGFLDLARAHMFCMVGLLDYRLQTLGIRKLTLTKALTRLIRLNAFDAELGKTGCYLTYKCISTMSAEKVAL